MTRRPLLARPWSTALLCGLTLLAPSFAASPTPQTDDKKEFDRLDISGNGYLTGIEISEEIRDYNTNGDRVVTWEEFSAGRARDRAARKLPNAAPEPAAKPLPATRPAATTKATVPAAPRPVKLPTLAARPGYVIGRAVFASGQPIPAFQVTALGWSGEIHLGPTGTAPNLGTLRAQNGRYAIRTTSEFDRKPVRANVISVQARAILNHGGKEFQLEMHPTDGKKDGSGAGSFRGDSGKGVVRDFVLRLYGPKRGYENNTPPRDSDTNEMSDRSFGAFYGGTVAITLPRDAYQTLEGATLTATFTPVGPLFDGSPAKAVVRTLALKKPNLYSAYFRDIPLGDYTVTASVTTADGASHPLRLRVLGGDLQPSVTVAFEPLGTWGVSTFTVLSERGE